MFLVLLAFAYIYVYRRTPLVFVVFFLVLFSEVPVLWSATFLDVAEVYISELEVYSSPSMGYWLLGAFFAFDLFVFYAVFRFLPSVEEGNSTKRLSSNQLHLASVVLLGIALVLLGHMLISTIPFFDSSVNKMNFWAGGARFPSLSVLHNQIMAYAIVLGMMSVFARRTGKPSRIGLFNLVTILLLLGYLVLMGYKFGLLLQVIYLYSLPLLIDRASAGKLHFGTIALKLGALLAVLFGVVALVYVRRYGDADVVLEVARQRLFVMEGQVWHVVMNDYLNGWGYLRQSFDDSNSFLDGMMRGVMSGDLYSHYNGMNVRLSNIYPAALFIKFDSVALVVAVYMMVTFATALSGYMIYRNVRQVNFLLSILWMKIFFVLRAFASSVDADELFSLKSLFWVGLLVMIYLIMAVRAGLRPSLRNFGATS